MNRSAYGQGFLRRLAIAMLLLGLSAWPAQASRATEPAAATLFVKPTGSGTTCAQAAPCTLQSALAKLADGDTVYFAEGT